LAKQGLCQRTISPLLRQVKQFPAKFVPCELVSGHLWKEFFARNWGEPRTEKAPDPFYPIKKPSVIQMLYLAK